MLIRALHPWGSNARMQPGQTLAARAFVTDRAPPLGIVARVKARHPAGDYVLPFPCRWDGERWRNGRTGTPIDVDVAGWRL